MARKRHPRSPAQPAGAGRSQEQGADKRQFQREPRRLPEHVIRKQEQHGGDGKRGDARVKRKPPNGMPRGAREQTPGNGRHATHGQTLAYRPEGGNFALESRTMNLENLKIIVTGGAQGMGRHFAQQLVSAGAHVAIGDVNESGLAEVIEATKANQKGTLHARRLDVSSEADIASFVAWAHAAMGGLNGLINNAGILRDALLVKKDRETGAVKTLSKDQWDAVIGVNLTGATLMTRDVVAKMVETNQRPGVIVNLSSIARHGNRGQSNYTAAKAALAANTVTWSKEFATFGIRVGAVAPGMVETPMTQGMNQKARDALVSAIPVGRVGVPEDIWLAVKFVIECDYFNGRCIDVDGGLSM